MRGDPIKYEVDKETGRGLRRPLHVDGDALPVQLRLHPAHALRRRRSVRRAPALADAADHRRRRPLPADRHAQDGRRGGRRFEDPRGPGRQAHRPVPHRARRRKTCPSSRRSRSPISSSTTRISSPASGCGCPRGSAPTKRSTKSWTESRATKQRSAEARRSLIAMTDGRARAPAARVPAAVRRSVEHRLHRGQVRARVRAAAHVPPLPLRARRGADGRRRAGDARGVAGARSRKSATSSSPRGSSMASIWAACWWRSRAACRLEWRRCSSACSRSSRSCSPAAGSASGSCRASGSGSRSGSRASGSSSGTRSHSPTMARRSSAILLALAGISVGTLYQKRYCSHVDLRCGAVSSSPRARSSTHRSCSLFEHAPVRWTPEFVFALGWAVVVLSVGAISLLYWLLRHGAASNVAGLVLSRSRRDGCHGVAPVRRDARYARFRRAWR